jgi:copper chaperone CopZ
MTCEACVQTVRRALLHQPGVIDADVSLAENLARVRITGGCDCSAVLSAVRETGFEATQIPSFRV